MQPLQNCGSRTSGWAQQASNASEKNRQQLCTSLTQTATQVHLQTSSRWRCSTSQRQADGVPDHYASALWLLLNSRCGSSPSRWSALRRSSSADMATICGRQQGPTAWPNVTC